MIVPKKSVLSLVAVIAVLAYAVFGNQKFVNSGTPASITGSVNQTPVQRAFDEAVSDVVLQVHGTVQRLLPDDLDGSRHQRFIVKTRSGLTVLVAHNIDLAPRIADVSVGEPIVVKGEYEWNEQGGVIHWTHRDPQGNHEGGWIEYLGNVYQ